MANAENRDVPKEILVSQEPADMKQIITFLKKIRGKSVYVKVPMRGEKKKTLLLAKRNAEIIHNDMIIQRKKASIPYCLLELEHLLKLPRTPNTIEAFDISNFGSSTIVASMVQFHSGKANKSGYRKYHIKAVDIQDDFASMREVVYRRYKRLVSEGEKLPDLILIDGGKGQLSSAMESLEKLNLTDKVPVIAIAKRVDEIFTPNNKTSLSLPKDSSALKLLQRIRNEAHRFAIAFSRKTHRKKMMRSFLSDIDGVGEKRKKKILSAFQNIESMKKASVEEIAKKADIPKFIAVNVKKYLEEHFFELKGEKKDGTKN